MNLLDKLKARFAGPARPEHLRRGELGERAAKKYLQKQGLKSRSSEAWTRPAAAVDARKKKLLSQTALDYLKLLKNPEVKFRFDIVEVLLADGAVREIRHLPNTFGLSRPYRYA